MVAITWTLPCRCPHLRRTAAFRTPLRRGAEVIPTIQAQPELPPLRLPTPRPHHPPRRGEGEEDRGEPMRDDYGPCLSGSGIVWIVSLKSEHRANHVGVA